MCKVMIAVGIKNPANALKLAKIITPKLSVGNDDGFGYSAIDAAGKVFGEKWLENDKAWLNLGLTEGDEKFLEVMGTDMVKEIPITDSYTAFGEGKLDDMVSLMIHARAATGTKSIENTHPFYAHNTALIHNGVIRNHEQLKKTMSTCDSETILHEYLDYNVAGDFNQIDGVIENIRGYYAVGVLTTDAEGKPIADVFKSNSAILHCTYVEEVGGVVFCTSKYDLESALKACGFKVNRIYEFGNDQVVRFDAVTGERIIYGKIEAVEAWSYTAPNRKTDHRHPAVTLPAKDELDAVIDAHSRDVNWVELIEKEEAERINFRNVN